MKKRRQIGFFLLALLVISGIGLVGWFNLTSRKVSAAWFDDNWKYRQILTVTNNGSAQTSYQLQVVVGTGDLVAGSKLQSNCNDIRFTDLGGNLLHYWNEYCFSSSGKSSSFWVTFPNLPAGSSQMYVYYGNPVAPGISSYSTLPTGINVGTGNDGSITVSSDTAINTTSLISGRSCSDGGDAVNYSVTENRSSATNTIVLSSTPSSGCLAAGDEVLIINLQGTSGNNSSVGQYEFARISSISTATLTLNHLLLNSYDGTSQKIMVQRVPNYSSVTVNSSINFTAATWDGSKSGVMAFRASGTVTVTGNIHANAKGFRGGSSVTGCANQYNSQGESYNGGYAGRGNSANGGGGGAGNQENCPDGTYWGQGGGGAGYGAAGTAGTTKNSPGLAGAGGSTYGTASLSQIFLGSGSGSGGVDAGTSNGAIGGGMVIITGTTITVGGTVAANGASGGTTTDAAPGGGSGGSVLMSGSTVTLGSNLVTASGGSGGTVTGAFSASRGDGGAGGAGRIAVNYSSSTGSTSPSATTSTLPISGTPSSEETALGPVGFWRFNEGQGTTVNDSTSNNNAGTLTGTTKPTWQTEDKCVSGKCLYFEGSTAYVSIPDSTALRPSTFTLSTWVNYTLTPHDTPLIAKQGSGSTQSYELYLNSGNNLSGQVSDGVTTVDAHNIYALSLGWHHVAMSWDGSTLKMYADGRLVFSKTQTITIAFGANPVLIGKDSAGAFFTGFIDEPKVYNYVRTDAQIKLDYESVINKGAGVSLGGNLANRYAALSSGLVGHWKLDESSGTRADSSGFGYNLSDWNTVTSNPGKFANGGQFTRANSEALYVSDNTDLSVTGDYTVSGWFYQDTTTSGDRCMICKGDVLNSKREFFLLRASGGSLQFYVSNDGTNTTGVTSSEFSNTASVWNFVVAWYDSTNKTINLQVNGGKVDTVSFTATPYDSDSQFMIGGSGNTLGTALSFFDGRIDDVRVYKRVLSEADRQTLYNFAPGPVGYWNFEEGLGTTNYDISSTANNLTMTSSPLFTAGKFGKALQFNGSSNYSVVAAAPTTMVTTWTLEAWINPASLSQLGMAVYNGNDSGGYGFGVGNGSGGSGSKLQILFGSVAWVDPGYTFASANVWYHVAVTRDGTTTTAYVNGVRALNTSTSTPGTVNAKFSVGMQYNTSNVATRFFNGLVDEVKIYNYSRTGKQIVEDMNGSHPSGGSPVGSQLAYFKFDEGQGTTTQSSVGTMSGSLTSMASPASVGISGWNPNGKFGKALSFDGTNDAVNLDSGASLMPYSSTDVTVSAWVNPSVISPSVSAVFSYGGDNCNCGYSIYYRSSGKIEFGIYSYTQSIDTDNLPIGKWSHVVGVYDHKYVYLYVNGVLKNKTALTTGIINATKMRIGSDYNGASDRYFFQGQIDEVKVYNYALTPAEILIDYNQNQAIKFGSLGVSTIDSLTASNSAATTYCVPGDTATCNLPVAELNFEEGQGGTVYDTSGNQNNGSWGGTAQRYGPGAVGKGGNFDGSSNYVHVTDATNLRPSSITVAAWVYYTVNNTDQIVIMKGNGVSNCTTGDSYALGMNFPAPIFRISDGSGFDYAGGYNLTIPVNTWVYEVGTYDGSTLSLYYNGKLFDSKSVSRTISYNASDILIGGSNCHGDSTPTGYFSGKIDGVKIYNYARTAAQVAWDYNRGLASSWWKMDECQGLVLHDSIGTQSATMTIGTGAGSGHQDSAGTCTTNASTVWYNGRNGKYNSSINLDGIDDYVPVESRSYPLTIPTSSDWSIGAWINPSSLPNTFNEIYAEGNSANTTQALRFYVGSGGDVNISLVSDQDVAYGASGPKNLSVNNWYHVFASKSGSVFNVCVNGICKATTSTLSGNFTFNRSSIGAITRSSGTSEYFTGQIDDLKVWSYGLTTYQIRNEFNQGAAVRFGPASGTP